MSLQSGIITALAAVLACLCLALWHAGSENKDLQAKLMQAQSELNKCQSALSVQNSLVVVKNAELTQYSDLVSQLQANYNTKQNELNNSLKSVKTCEQGMAYLKTMLQGLK